MEFTTLGTTGMSVSRICVGCGAFGYDSSSMWDWSVSEDESREIIERALDLGINFFDTANTYSWGDSERVLGSVLSEYDRDDLVVASKVHKEPMKHAHENATGLSRKTIEQELTNSLERLGMETLDLYQIHRWDYETPIEETLRVLDDAVRRREVRYLGASSMWAHQFADALHTSSSLDLERFATMQNQYSLVYREEEREMLPLCEKEGVGVIPWGPLAKGFLARPHEELYSTVRGRTDDVMQDRPYTEKGGRRINEHVQELAAEKGVSMAQIALAWLLHKDRVDAPIVGMTSVDHLEDAVEALQIDLGRRDIEYLEEPYEPISVYGHE